MKDLISLIRKNILFFVLIIVTILYVVLNKGDSSSEMIANSTTELTTFTPNTVPVINSNFDSSFIVSTLVDTKLLEVNGKEKWAYSTMYQEPKTDFAGNYLAIWNKNTNGNIDIYNKKGFVYKISNTNQVLDVDINKNGYVSVLTKDTAGSGYILNVYNNKGESLVNRVSDTENIFPISASISDDGRMVSLCEIDTNFLQPKSYITFSYVNQSDNKNGELIFSGLTINNEIIAKVEYHGNYILAFTDSKIHIMLVANDVAKETAVIELNNDLDFCEIIDGKYIAMVLGSPKNSKASSPNTVMFYNFNGNEVSKYSFETEITDMTPAENSVIIVSNRIVNKVSSSGKVDFTYIHGKDVYGAYYVGKKKPMIIVEFDRIVAVD